MFVSLEEAKRLIRSGKLLHIAADESLLEQLPKGKWIAGTTPYFITNEGGVMTKEKLFVHILDFGINCKVKTYDKNTIANITKDAYPSGVTFLLMPFASDVAAYYCKEAPKWEELLLFPIVGWITGFDLGMDAVAKVYDGFDEKSYTDQAIALHLEVEEDKLPMIGIVNIFESPEKGDIVEFPKDALDVTDCMVNGETKRFYNYIVEHEIDTQMPLVADYNGVYINVSIKDMDAESGKVSFYAPVFADQKYHFAKKIANYDAAFQEKLSEFRYDEPLFSCNCILNYLYGGLEGKTTEPFEGPVTFGEVAYQLLNQTLVYLTINS